MPFPMKKAKDEADPQLNAAATKAKPKPAPAKKDPAGDPAGAKESKPGAEPKLSPEAESARTGGMMARLPAAPPGVLAEKPDPRTSYQTSEKDMDSPLISISKLSSAASAAPKPAGSGIDVGKGGGKLPALDDEPDEEPEEEPEEPAAKPFGKK